MPSKTLSPYHKVVFFFCISIASSQPKQIQRTSSPCAMQRIFNKASSLLCSLRCSHKTSIHITTTTPKNNTWIHKRATIHKRNGGGVEQKAPYRRWACLVSNEALNKTSRDTRSWTEPLLELDPLMSMPPNHNTTQCGWHANVVRRLMTVAEYAMICSLWTGCICVLRWGGQKAKGGVF